MERTAQTRQDGLARLRTLALHGDNVAYRDEGDGEVLLLIHGIGGNSDCWRHLLPKLSTRYRVIAPDLLGHGQSDKPRGDYSLGAFAVWLRDFLTALNIREVTVIGHSFGGGVALQFAHQHPEHCRRLVLISSGGLGPDLGPLLRMMSLPGAELVLPMLASRPVLKVADVLRDRATSDGREVTRYGETTRALGALANRQSRSAFLRTLRSVVDHRGQAVCALNRLRADLPTMIIFGDQDRCIPVAHGYSAHRALPGSRLHVIAGAGHQPQVERPEDVVRFVDDFVADTRRPVIVAGGHPTDSCSSALVNRGAARRRRVRNPGSRRTSATAVEKSPRTRPQILLNNTTSPTGDRNT